MKSRQLSLFTDREVMRSAIHRAFYHPNRVTLQEYRFEAFYGIQHPLIREMVTAGYLIIRWNVLRHHHGAKNGTIKRERHRFFYE